MIQPHKGQTTYNMDYIQIGFTKKTHGIAGELKFFIEEPYEDIFLEKDRIFLEIRGNKQPFFVESVRGAGDLIVKLEDIKVREDALLLQSKPVFLPASEIPEDLDLTELEAEYAGLTGYLLTDQSTGDIGHVQEVLEMPQQEMAVVLYQGKEVLIPLNALFIVEVDHAGRKVLMDLPEGLLEL